MILFYFHPDKLYQLDCSMNFRPDHCFYESNCKTAERQGVRILHGSRGAFHNNNEVPSFRLIYETFKPVV